MGEDRAADPEAKAFEEGRPKPVEKRGCFEGILWVLRSSTRLKHLPPQYPLPATCWRWLQNSPRCGMAMAILIEHWQASE